MVNQTANDNVVAVDFTIPNNLNAMAKKFFLKVDKPLRETDWFIKGGSTVTGVKVIAKGDKIRDIAFLIENNPLPNGKKTKINDWYKCRGTADITNGKITYVRCEVHWYQCENIGKIEFKVKKWGHRI